MKIVLDTNIIFQTKRRLLEGPEIDAIQAMRETTPVEFVVPEVVRAEVLNKYGELFRERKRTFDESCRAMQATLLTGEQITVAPSLTEEQAVKAYEEMLDDRLSSLQATIPKYPDVTHDDIVTRCLLRRKPFSSSGRGYRDSLIWETVLRQVAASGHKTILVTNNSKDFADGHGKLHSDLQEDLKRAELSCESVLLCSSLKEFIHDCLLPEQGKVESLRKLLDSGEWEELGDLWTGLHDDITAAIREKFHLDDKTISNMVGVQVSAARFEDFDINVQEAFVSDVRMLDDDRAFASCPASFLVEIEFLVSKKDCDSLSRHESISVKAADWNEEIALASGVFEMDFSIDCILDRRNLRIISWDVSSLGLGGLFY